MNTSSDHLLTKACFRQPVSRTPVWVLRQTGRYLPQYRAVRAKNNIFTMYKTPELNAELTLMPVKHMDVDAAVLFTDMLSIPEAMGMKLKLAKGKWPVFVDPIKNEYQVNHLNTIDPYESLDYVMDSIRIVQNELDEKLPLIGICGAPWSLAAYMIQGGGSQSFIKAKRWVYARPELMRKMMDKITQSVIEYCEAIMDVGVDVIQLSDLYAGVLDETQYESFALPYVRKIIDAIRRPDVPVIYQSSLPHIRPEKLLETNADVFSVDWTMHLGQLRDALQGRAAVQGNLDPAILYAKTDDIREAVRTMLAQYGEHPGHIANLGFDIPPDVPFEHARMFVEAVKSESVVFHNALGVA